MKEQILIVEDDTLVAEGLTDILSGYGYETMTVEKAEEVLTLLKQKAIRLVLLDIELGEENGYDICKKIRQMSNVPILFLTAYTGEMELVRAFQMGGDDYLTKPFRMQELLVRVQALIRRYTEKEADKLKSGNLIYDRNIRELIEFETKEKIELTPIEKKLVEVLLLSYPRTITREEILYKVWDEDAEFVEENTLNVNMSRLREKLGMFDGESYIVTVRGVGYRWNITVQR